MLIGETSRTVSQRVAAKITISQRLAELAEIRTVYDRTALVDRTIPDSPEKPRRGPVWSCRAVHAAGNLRPRSSSPWIIPLSMLFTITGMVENKVSANLMSLGALDFRDHRRGHGLHRGELLRLLAEVQHKARTALREASASTLCSKERERSPSEPVRLAHHQWSSIFRSSRSPA